MLRISWLLLVPDECPSTGPIEECPTCCCESSDNIEFYDPESPEPECTASSALYEMRFNFTWNEVCHPGDYESNQIWSTPIGVSHNTNYRLWDACMDNVSVAVGLVLKTGLATVIIQEFMAVGDNILEYVIPADFQLPTSTSSLKLAVDQDHQWVSAISARVPAHDQLVGVADLRLCDGDKWKESVKVCFELFSTATVSDRVASENERNSVQGNSCSYGSIEFRFLEVFIIIALVVYRDGKIAREQEAVYSAVDYVSLSLYPFGLEKDVRMDMIIYHNCTRQSLVPIIFAPPFISI